MTTFVKKRPLLQKGVSFLLKVCIFKLGRTLLEKRRYKGEDNYVHTQQQKDFDNSSPMLPACGQPRMGGAAGHDNGNH